MHRHIRLAVLVAALATASTQARAGVVLSGTVNCSFVFGNVAIPKHLYSDGSSFGVKWKWLSTGYFFGCGGSSITSIPPGATLWGGVFQTKGNHDLTFNQCQFLDDPLYSGKGRVRWWIILPNGKWTTAVSSLPNILSPAATNMSATVPGADVISNFQIGTGSFAGSTLHITGTWDPSSSNAGCADLESTGATGGLAGYFFSPKAGGNNVTVP